ncbi:M1 family aminopeptidase [Reichenbachiella sp. MALMAid0571]|uniref:M1 family metallopeptidase n=1 Tax=Reichenbachiella sp. MALMAid0571 TaxID=3143939 RepID=UPI0032E00B4A
MQRKLLVCAILILLGACRERIFYSVDEGVSKELAGSRKQNISFLSYDLSFSIPIQRDMPVTGSSIIGVKLKSIESPLVLDFNPQLENAVKALKVNGETEQYEIENGHIIIAPSALITGYNEIEIDFVSGDQSLNRSEDFLYTLFVPDRASTAFPCFDQPDLKAKYKLQLDIPNKWLAMSNAPVVSEKIKDNVKSIIFEESDIISTYLFSFVAGKFESITKNFDDITMTMFHRETDQLKVAKNKEDIFKLHYQSLKWLEKYTSVAYPFKKFDFVLIPGFQYGGMEHVGAIQYRDSKLLLDESATLNDKISRSMLIAHETAHTWFGNLVTMEWFDDVWMKEVFANFMASKITEPNFPDINHELNFLFNHYPPAYTIDRTEGANAIRQNLDNLKNAGTMYGDIIYHKAPIVMRQLEELMGEFAFRDALREYLENFKEKNATWNDLVEIMDVKTEVDLKKWSQVWINEAGMPFIDIEFIDQNGLGQFEIIQYDLFGKNRVWPQKFNISFSYTDGDIRYPVYSENSHFTIKKNEGTEMPQFVQMNTNAFGYGIFAYGLDYFKDEFQFNMARIDIPSMLNDLDRGAAYLVLHEYLLHEGMNPLKYFRFLEEYIYVEDNELILTYLLDNLEMVYWKFLTVEQTKELAAEVESLLTQKLSRVSDPKVKHLVFKKYISMAHTEGGVRNLMNFWNKTSAPEDMELSENEFISLAYNIQLKSNQITGVIEDQIKRMSNPDRQAEVRFVSQSLSLDPERRKAFFLSLLEPENREHEAWVNQALYFLNHPLRADTSIDYLELALEEVKEIQKTGDIFFPKRWLDNTLWGHNSGKAVEIINRFLENNEDLDEKLKQKVLQSVDMVFRAETDISQYAQSN